MGKKRILILYNKLFHYRVPIFEILAEHYDLTVAYSIGKPQDLPYKFKTIFLPITQIGRFVIHKDCVNKLCSNYDVVIGYGDIAWLKITSNLFRKNRKYKMILWTIGVSASYDKKYNAVSRWDKIRNYIYKRADALLLYSSFPVAKYVAAGFNKNKIFIANNTVAVHPISTTLKKDSLLFIGTMYFQKGIMYLLSEYLKAYNQNPNIPDLNLIGDGPDLENVKKWIDTNSLAHKIKPIGAVYDIDKKAQYFEKAFAVFSPLQAGLSVLESMGYGVPFVTMYDSITGGERFNIVNQENGILLNDVSEISSVILDIANNNQKYIEMGEKAKCFYDSNRKPVDMAQGIIDAIEYTLSQ